MSSFLYVFLCFHVSCSAFLYNALQKGIIHGLSTQTVLAFTMSASLYVVTKLYWPVRALLHNQPLDIDIDMDTDWQLELSSFVLELFLMMASLYLVCNKQQAKADNDELQDDFGRKPMHYLWHVILGIERAPPAFLHWGFIYLVAFSMFILTVFASSHFSLTEAAAWAYDRPTAMAAIVSNYVRGVAWLPQLHVSREVGVVSPVLAIWIVMLFCIDVSEVVNDVINQVDWCYIVGDTISVLLIADLLWVFAQSCLRGKTVLEVPSYEASLV